jgi:cytochrome P450
LTKDDVKGEIRMLIINGNSLAGAVMWMLYVVSKNQQHADMIANDGTYARWAFMEVLRMYPPFHLLSYEPKQGPKCPFHFWKGSTELVSVRDTHMSEQNWNQPETFDPTRFAKGLAHLKKGSYIPFGGGERGCPGSGLTMKVGPDIMQMICRSFVVELQQEPVIKRRIELTPKGNKIFFKLKKVKHANEN